MKKRMELIKEKKVKILLKIIIELRLIIEIVMRIRKNINLGDEMI